MILPNRKGNCPDLITCLETQRRQGCSALKDVGTSTIAESRYRAGHRRSISVSISSAQRIASEIAQIVAGTRFSGRYAANFVAARIAAAIKITRLRPSSTVGSLSCFAFYSPSAQCRGNYVNYPTSNGLLKSGITSGPIGETVKDWYNSANLY